MSDSTLLAAWAEYKRLQTINYSVEDFPAGGFDTEDAFYAARDVTEIAIEQARATTIPGIVAKLWLGLLHTDQDRDFDRAASCGDVASIFAGYDDLDWDKKLIVGAIRDLEAMAEP